MDDYVTRGTAQRRILDLLLADDVRPLLRSRGFTKSGRTFVRVRGPLYDRINFQGSWHNANTPLHEFFVNVGVGSIEMDAVHPGLRDDGKPIRDYVLAERWDDLVAATPATVFDEDTDMRPFAEAICTTLNRVLAVIDSIDTSVALAHWVAARNRSSSWKKTCGYLASIDDTAALIPYVAALREWLHGAKNWPLFNQELIDAAGRLAPSLIERGLLDPPA